MQMLQAAPHCLLKPPLQVSTAGLPHRTTAPLLRQRKALHLTVLHQGVTVVRMVPATGMQEFTGQSLGLQPEMSQGDHVI